MCVFSKPSYSAPAEPAPLPAAPREMERESALAKDEERRRLRANVGSSANVITGGMGLTPTQNVTKPTVLGR